MGGTGDSEQPDLPSSDAYEKLRKEADDLRQTSLSDQSDKAKKRRKVQSGMHAYARYTGIGIQFVLVIALGLAAGYGLDYLLGTDPWLMVTGAMVGSVGAMVWVVRTVLRMEARAETRGKDRK